ncbi:MAG: 2-oxo acid dehydrogenase subunit E2 [Chloroflexi bacterium]|nr:2-oxo acid dehydrogenase subunit E2 [Chloroflexota bacterium]
MATNVLLPALGFDMTSGAVARWLKKEGDAVREGEPIAEVDTEKATVEIPAFATGVLQKILVPAGQNVPVGTTIAIVGAPGETSAMSVSPKSNAPVATAPTQVSETKSQPSNGDSWVKASPVARRIAEVEGVNLADVAGTGPNGRIIQRDVEAYLTRRPSGVPAPAMSVAPRAPVAPTPTSPPSSLLAGEGRREEVALSRIRQAIARRMTESKTTVPHFYVTFEINMTDAMKMREQLNNLASAEDKISVNDLVVAAAAKTLKKWRTFNASFRGDKLELHGDINIGVAVALDDGLITPVLHHADQKSLKELARDTKALVERTRANKMRADDLTGGTFSVSNLGMYGVEEFSAIIVPPEAAILAVSAIIKKPSVIGEQIQIAQMMKATISVDHRVADGAQAAQFMRDLKALLENPVNLLID